MINELANRVINWLQIYAPIGSLDRTFARLTELEWFKEDNSENVQGLLFSTPGKTLAVQLQELADGKRFANLTLFTGSTDKKGKFLEWCIKELGITNNQFREHGIMLGKMFAIKPRMHRLLII